ncbi:MAG TPA: hypothetical protein DCZ94_08225 [Lentisphaeria bacterium]|nr:MAG: hypothetical protein A2X48_19705 [Lentisphaerae bacterium GWF2_49_21]HBC86923.1 hypothetical protein [Lentisphaeria bacterium]
MLLRYKDTSYFEELFSFRKDGGGDDMPLPAMLLSCGHSNTSQYPNYLCDGQHPAIIPFAVWQYTLAGEGILDFEDKKGIPLSPGTLMLLTAPHVYRYYPADPSGNWDFLFVCMNGSTALNFCRELTSFHGPVNRLPSASPSVASARKILSEAHKRKINSRWTASMLAYELIMNTSRDLATCAPGHSYPHFIIRALDYCTSHADRPLSVGDLAKASGFSHYHFVRQFKKNVGIPPSEYIREVRLSRARHLLQMSTASIKEIADICGFASVAHFSRTFRSKFGISPGKIRRTGG